MEYKISDNSKCGVIGYGSWATALVHVLEKPAVCVGEHGDLRLEIRIALRLGRIEDAEKRQKRAAEVLCLSVLEERPERVLRKEVCIFGVEQEDEPDAESVEEFQRFRRIRVGIALKQLSI